MSKSLTKIGLSITAASAIASASIFLVLKGTPPDVYFIMLDIFK